MRSMAVRSPSLYICCSSSFLQCSIVQPDKYSITTIFHPPARSSTAYSSGANPSPANNSCTSFEYVRVNLITIIFDFPSACAPFAKNTSAPSASRDLYSKVCSIPPSVVYEFLLGNQRSMDTDSSHDRYPGTGREGDS